MAEPVIRLRDAELLGALLDRVGEAAAVFAVDPRTGEARLAAVNRSFVALTGWSTADVVGALPGQLIADDTPGDAVERAYAGFERGRIDQAELRLRTVGGSVLVEVTVFTHVDQEGAVWLGALYRDLTARLRERAAARRLRQSEEWAHALLEGGTDVVMVTDAAGVVYYVSPAITAMLGYEPDELVGTVCFDLIDPDQLGEVADEWQDLLADDRQYFPAHFRARHRDGTWRSVDVSARNMIRHPSVQGMVIHVRDVTERTQAEEALRRSEEWAQALVQGGSDIVIVVDREARVLYASPSARTVLGYDPDVMVGADAFGFVHPDDVAATRDAFVDEIEHSRRALPTRVRTRHADGRWLHLSITFTNMLEHRAVGGVVINARDITGRWEAEQLLAQQAQALEAVARGAPLDSTLYRVAQMLEERLPGSHCGVGVVSDDGTIVLRAAPSLDRQTVLAIDDVSPRSELGQVIRAGGRRVVTFLNLTRDPRWVPVLAAAPKVGRFACWSQLIGQPGSRETLGSLIVFHPEGRPPTEQEAELLDRMMFLAAIAIERRNFEAALEHQALHDELTGLPNRTLLHDRVAQALATARRRGTQVAVLFLDLDRFKVINDSLGHSVGDELLKQAATRLRQPLRLGDTLGRLGGDEFLVLCEQIDGEQDAVEIATRLLDQMATPFLLDGTEVFVSTSVGIALAGDGGADWDPGSDGAGVREPLSAEALIRNADMAMYRAKEQGRARYAVFEEDLARRAVVRHELEQALRSALEDGQFELYYQPLVRLADGTVAGVEALIRWNRPEHGLVEPTDFIPVAEDAGLILPIGSWVIEEACRQAREWPAPGEGTAFRVSVNLSARQLADPSLIDRIAEHLTRFGLPPERLCVEITESVLVDDVDAAVATVAKLKALGVLIAIDDFGTGYATLEYLRRFSMADYLKIDRSFVEDVDTGSKETAIVAGAISLAQSLGFTVVAEGVQTEAQVATLRGLGCDLAQGFYFSRPLPAAPAVALLGSTATF